MVKQKRAAILVYPEFSSYEISILSAIFKTFEKGIVVFSADKTPVDSEEGFHFVPDKTLDEFDIDEYDCLVLPGMWCFPNILNDSRYITFLRQFKDNRNIIIASISSSPILLAKAGVLEGKKYCAGLFEEDIDKYDFIDRDNLVRAPLVADGNIITALGLAYREFAIEVGRKLNFDCDEGWFSGIKKPIVPEDYTFHRNITENILLKNRTLENVKIFWEKSHNEEIKRLFPLRSSTLAEAIQMYEESLKPDAESFGKVIYVDDEYIGDVWCYEIDETNEKQAFVSIIIFDKTCWGRGIGKHVLEQFCRIAFERYDINKLCAFTYKTNQRSIGVLESAGFMKIEEFEEDGVLSYYYELLRPVQKSGAVYVK